MSDTEVLRRAGRPRAVQRVPHADGRDDDRLRTAPHRRRGRARQGLPAGLIRLSPDRRKTVRPAQRRAGRTCPRSVVDLLSFVRGGEGPVAFASSTFGHCPPGGVRQGADGRSVPVVPRVVVGRRGGRCWITEPGPVADHPAFVGDAVGDPALLGPRAMVCRPGPSHRSAG